MGGVINIISESPHPMTGVAADLNGGSLGTHTQSVQARYGTDRLGAVLRYRHFDTDGFVTVPSYQRGPIDTPVGSGHHQFSGRLSWELVPGTTATVSGTLLKEDRSFGTPLSIASRTIGTTAFGLKGEAGSWGAWETKVFGQWQTFRNQSALLVPSPFVLQQDQLDRLQTIPSNDFGGMAQWTIPVASFSRLVVGSDVRGIIAQSEEQLFPSQGRLLARGKQIGLGTFGEWIVEPAQNLVLTTSVRWDWWKSLEGMRQTLSGTTVGTQDNVGAF